MLFDDQISLSALSTHGYRFCQSLIKLCGLDWTAPDYIMLCRRQQHIDITISYQKSSDGLHLLVDSTGLKFLGEGEWKRKKHGSEYRRQWRKFHIDIDAETLQIRAVQLTTNDVSDSQVLEDLLAQIPLDEQINSVYTDGAYDTKHCRQVILDRDAHAVIGHSTKKECKAMERSASEVYRAE